MRIAGGCPTAADGSRLKTTDGASAHYIVPSIDHPIFVKSRSWSDRKSVQPHWDAFSESRPTAI